MKTAHLICVITHPLAPCKLEVVHGVKAASPPSSRKVLRTTVLVGKRVSPVHSAPKGPFTVPGHQPSVSPLTWVYVSLDNHTAYKGVCAFICVRREPFTLVTKWYFHVMFRLEAPLMWIFCFVKNLSCFYVMGWKTLFVCVSLPLTLNTIWMWAISGAVNSSRAARKTRFPWAGQLFHSHL